jgi:hypothetical protein
MKSIGEIAQEVKLEKTRKTERGELMRFFTRHLNVSRAADGHAPISMPRMGKILEGIPTGDLYYLQSVCTKAKNFSKKFWYEVDPKKHIKENAAPF